MKKTREQLLNEIIDSEVEKKLKSVVTEELDAQLNAYSIWAKEEIEQVQEVLKKQSEVLTEVQKTLKTQLGRIDKILTKANPPTKAIRTPFDVEQLKKLADGSKTVKEIAAIFNKSVGAVRQKLYELGLADKVKKLRTIETVIKKKKK